MPGLNQEKFAYLKAKKRQSINSKAHCLAHAVVFVLAS